MDVWRVRSSGGSPERMTHQHAAVNFLAPLDSRTLLYMARAEDWSGPWLWALDVETQVARRVPFGRGPVHVGRRQPRRPPHRRHRRQSQRDSGACRSPIGSPRSAMRTVPAADSDGTRLAPRSAAIAVLSLGRRQRRRTLEGAGRTGVGNLEGRRRRLVRAARGLAGRTPRRRRRQARGERHLSIMAADGTNARRRWPPSIDIEGAAGQGTADWSPDGNPDRHRRPRRARAGAVHDPGDGRRRPSGSSRAVGQSGVVAGRRPDRLRRPISRRPGRASWRCDRTARPLTCPTCWSGRAAIVSCPTDGAGVFAAHSVAGFLAFDLATKKPAQLTSLGNQGTFGRSTSHPTEIHRVRPLSAELEHRPDRVAAKVDSPPLRSRLSPQIQPHADHRATRVHERVGLSEVRTVTDRPTPGLLPPRRSGR